MRSDAPRPSKLPASIVIAFVLGGLVALSIADIWSKPAPVLEPVPGTIMGPEPDEPIPEPVPLPKAKPKQPAPKPKPKVVKKTTATIERPLEEQWRDERRR